MKIVQILDGRVHWDCKEDVPSLEYASTHFAPYIHFVEAPDYVNTMFTYDETAEGDARFIPPMAEDGYIYDLETGTFYKEGEAPPSKNFTELFSRCINDI